MLKIENMPETGMSELYDSISVVYLPQVTLAMHFKLQAIFCP